MRNIGFCFLFNVAFKTHVRDLKRERSERGKQNDHKI